MPARHRQGISLQGRAAWSPAAEKWLERYFENEIEPVLSPLGLDPARPFPRIQNKSLNFIVPPARQGRIRPRQRARHRPGTALSAARRAGAQRGSERTLMLLSVIVHTFVQKLFAGIEVLGCYQFRVTRNSDLFVDEEEIDDLRPRAGRRARPS